MYLEVWAPATGEGTTSHRDAHVRAARNWGEWVYACVGVCFSVCNCSWASSWTRRGLGARYQSSQKSEADTGGTKGPNSWLLEETGGPSYRRASGVQGSATGGVISLHQVPERPISMCVSGHEAAGRAGVNYWIYWVSTATGRILSACTCACGCAGAALSTSNWNGAASHTASLTCPRAGNCRGRGCKTCDCIDGVSKTSYWRHPCCRYIYLCIHIPQTGFHPDQPERWNKVRPLVRFVFARALQLLCWSIRMTTDTCTRNVCMCAHVPTGNTWPASPLSG